MNTPNRSPGFLAAYLTLTVGSAMSALSTLKPVPFGPAFGFSVAAVIFSIWGISRAVLRSLMTKVSLFTCSITSLAILLQLATTQALNTVLVLAIGASVAISWFFGTAVLLPALGIGFDVLFSKPASMPPTNEPEKTEWGWKEAAYIGAVLKPGGMLFVFLLVSVAMWFVPRSTPPHAAGPLTISLLAGPLLVPFIFLLGWFLSWTQDARSIFVKFPMVMNKNDGLLAILIFVLAAAGSRLFDRPVLLPLLILASAVFLMLIISILKVSIPLEKTPSNLTMPSAQQARPAPARLLFILLFALAVSAYSTLLVLSL